MCKSLVVEGSVGMSEKVKKATGSGGLRARGTGTEMQGKPEHLEPCWPGTHPVPYLRGNGKTERVKNGREARGHDMI